MGPLLGVRSISKANFIRSFSSGFSVCLAGTIPLSPILSEARLGRSLSLNTSPPSPSTSRLPLHSRLDTQPVAVAIGGRPSNWPFGSPGFLGLSSRRCSCRHAADIDACHALRGTGTGSPGGSSRHTGEPSKRRPRRCRFGVDHGFSALLLFVTPFFAVHGLSCEISLEMSTFTR